MNCKQMVICEFKTASLKEIESYEKTEPKWPSHGLDMICRLFQL